MRVFDREMARLLAHGLGVTHRQLEGTDLERVAGRAREHGEETPHLAEVPYDDFELVTRDPGGDLLLELVEEVLDAQVRGPHVRGWNSMVP